MEINDSTLEVTYQALGIELLTDVEKTEVLNHFGSAVLENALLRFMSTQGDWEQESFENWITAHAAETDMFEKAVIEYPIFAKVLTEEILQLSQAVVPV